MIFFQNISQLCLHCNLIITSQFKPHHLCRRLSWPLLAVPPSHMSFSLPHSPPMKIPIIPTDLGGKAQTLDPSIWFQPGILCRLLSWPSFTHHAEVTMWMPLFLITLYVPWRREISYWYPSSPTPDWHKISTQYILFESKWIEYQC